METSAEKPIIPAEPPEPVLCGSMAIGAVSLAVAKASAVLDNNPLYLNIALLKHHQVSAHYTPLQEPWVSQHEWTMFLISSCFPAPPPPFQEQPEKLTIPLLMVSLVSCGKSSPGKLNLMKEVICIPHPGLTAKQVPYIISKYLFFKKKIFIISEFLVDDPKAYDTNGKIIK